MVSDKLNMDALNNLSKEEKELAIKILKEYAETGLSETLDDLKYNDFDEIPVDIDTFLDDDRYLGKGLCIVDEFTGERKSTLFPYWRKTLHKIFPNNLTTKYNTLILTGSIGLGKTICAVIAMLYLLYRMLCLKDPYTHYGMMPSDKISFSMLNCTMEAARGVGWDKLQQLVQGSEWFMAHGTVNASRVNPQWQPNHHIELVFGSSNRHVVGRALFCLDGNTEIVTADGEYKLQDLVDKSIKVISIGENNKQIISDFCIIKPTIKTNEEFQIELEDGTLIKCTPNHRFLLKNGEYKEAQYLTEDDELADIKKIDNITYNEYIQNIINTRGQWNIPNNTYFESHHILPKCLGGTGKVKAKHKNIIWLYPEEHYIAHKLLAIENPTNKALVNAWEMMAYPKGKTKRSYPVSADDYAILRKLGSDCMKINNPGLDKEGHPWNYGLGIKKPKSFIFINNGDYKLKIAENDPIPTGFKKGRLPYKKKPLLSKEEKQEIFSKIATGKNNPRYNKGYKISGGKNGHATIRYFYENKTFECGKDLISFLNKEDPKISESTIRKLKAGSVRVLKEHPILTKISWEEK